MPSHRYSQNSIEALQMDHLRSAPSQQQLVNSRSPSLNHQDDQDQDQDSIQQQQQQANRPHKLDYYSIPVFLLEVIVLIGLAYSAYYIHFEYKHEPNVPGFYCDDTTIRQPFIKTNIIKQFIKEDNEIIVVALLLAVPITLIILCELINSMFGALKFRQIRALCACCKLHSITRRTIRFSGAYALGFLIVMISCDILANTSGHLRPYFSQECPILYNHCLQTLGLANDSQASARNNPSLTTTTTSTSTTTNRPVQPNFNQLVPSAQVISSVIGSNISSSNTTNQTTSPVDTTNIHPLSQPISSSSQQASNTSLSVIQPPTTTTTTTTSTQRPSSSDDQPPPARFKRDTPPVDYRGLFERKWIDLRNTNITEECDFRGGDDEQTRFFDTIAMSWPSFPAAICTYSCLFIACYLCFVGTARPFRLISSVLVVCLLLLATIFNVHLVNEHFNHWEDVVGGAVLALVVVIFVLLVYLNKFRDTHYFENQKVIGNRPRSGPRNNSFKRFNNDIALNQYNLDKVDGPADGRHGENMQNGDTIGSISNNDLAMRYFQIPRANYRGAPRPMSHMRS